MISKKILSGLLMSTMVLSGCGKAVDDSVSVASSLNPFSPSSTTEELQILENLPEGTLAFATKNTTGLQSKAEIIFSLKDYLPEEIQKNMDDEFPASLQKELINAYILSGINTAGIIRPKKDEILFAAMPTNLDAIAQENICAAMKFVVEKKRAKNVVSEILKSEKMVQNMSEEEKKQMEKFLENPDDFIAEISEKIKGKDNFKTFQKYGDVEFSSTDTLLVAKVWTQACDENDQKILEEFQLAVYEQDRMNEFVSLDQKFLKPFLAEGNLAIAKIAFAEGEKQLLEEAKQNGFDEAKFRKLKSEILDPWKRMNISKMFASFQKISYVSGLMKGNFADRESELLLQFSDEEMAELFAEIQTGKIPQNKLWLHDGATMTADVSRNGGTVYDYVKYENTEYPSIISSTSGGIVVITMIGVLATGSTALYTAAQEKARDAVRQSDLQMIKTGLVQQYADDGKYPENLQVLVENGYLMSVPRDPKYFYEYDYEVMSGGQGFKISTEPEASKNYGNPGFEIRVNFPEGMDGGEGMKTSEISDMY